MNNEEMLDLEKLSPDAIRSAEETSQLVDSSADPMRDRSNCTAAYAPPTWGP